MLERIVQETHAALEAIIGSQRSTNRRRKLMQKIKIVSPSVDPKYSADYDP